MEARLLPLAAAASPLHGTPVEGAAAAATTSARWLPWLVAAVAAIALIAGLRSCRTEQAKLAAAPVATTPIVTEAPVVLETVSLPDGTVLELQPGAVGLELARFLAGAEPAPRAFRFEAFGYGSAEDRLDGEGEAAVRAVASIMRAWPTVEARIIGHTDDQGEAAANAALSARRASMVEAAIEAAGIAADRIESEGRGEEEPIATNETAEGRAQNRRTIILVIRK
jgi:outer membrane protein OmpA-like peptidoglycan-associated protein